MFERVRAAGPQAWSGRGVECEHVSRVSRPRGSPALVARPLSWLARPPLSRRAPFIGARPAARFTRHGSHGTVHTAWSTRHGPHGTVHTARFTRHPSAAPESDTPPGATASPTPPRVGAAGFQQKPPRPRAASLRPETPGRSRNLTQATGGPMAPAPHRRPTGPRATPALRRDTGSGVAASSTHGRASAPPSWRKSRAAAACAAAGAAAGARRTAHGGPLPAQRPRGA